MGVAAGGGVATQKCYPLIAAVVKRAVCDHRVAAPYGDANWGVADDAVGNRGVRPHDFYSGGVQTRSGVAEGKVCKSDAFGNDFYRAAVFLRCWDKEGCFWAGTKEGECFVDSKKFGVSSWGDDDGRVSRCVVDRILDALI